MVVLVGLELKGNKRVIYSLKFSYKINSSVVELLLGMRKVVIWNV